LSYALAFVLTLSPVEHFRGTNFSKANVSAKHQRSNQP
jgi:hypothetical protein